MKNHELHHGCDDCQSISKGFTGGGPLLFQFIYALAIGIILSPFSGGVIILIIFIIIFEIYFIYCTGTKHWHPEDRIVVIGAFVLGFVVGRLIVGDLDPVRPFYHKYPRRHRYRRRMFHYR